MWVGNVVGFVSAGRPKGRAADKRSLWRTDSGTAKQLNVKGKRLCFWRSVDRTHAELFTIRFRGFTFFCFAVLRFFKKKGAMPAGTGLSVDTTIPCPLRSVIKLCRFF